MKLASILAFTSGYIALSTMSTTSSNGVQMKKRDTIPSFRGNSPSNQPKSTNTPAPTLPNEENNTNGTNSNLAPSFPPVALIPPAPSSSENLASIYQKYADATVLGAVLIIMGTFYVLFGFRLFRLTVAITGGALMAYIAIIILPYIEAKSPNGIWDNRETIYLSVFVSTFVVFGIVSYFLKRFGVSIIGACAGIALAALAMSFIPTSVLSTSYLRALILVVFIILGIVLGYLLSMRPFVIVFTSIIGAFMLLVGVDCFIHIGFISSLEAISSDASQYALTSSIGLMLTCGVLVMIIGTAFQFLTTKPKKDVKADEEQTVN